MDDVHTRAGERTGGCPHVNRNDLRCATRFSLGRIDQAFCVCFGAFYGCPMYHRINRELARAEHRARAAVELTVLGHGIEQPLRATGT